MPQRPLVRATRGGGVLTPSSGSQTSVSTLSFNQGGFGLGAAVAGGGNRLIVPITAPYLVLGVEANPAGALSVAVKVNGMTTIASTGVVLEHTGTTPLDFGYDKTELTLVML